jgi:hypothetical protein
VQLSVQQTQELLRIIDKNQLTVIGSELGSEFLTEYDKELLRKYGINPDTLYLPELSSIQTSFHFGMLAEALGAIEAAKINYADLRQYIKDGRYIPVSTRQQAAIQSIKMQTFSSLKTLGGNIFADVNNILTDKTQAGQQEFLAQELKDGIDKRLTVSQIAHEIARKTGDWGRNFDRIIETESQNAFEQGKAAEIQRRNPDKDPLVYKHVQNGACKHCIRLYLTNGLGSQPKIFKLSELTANGINNVGRKVEDWLPVIGATHPHCRCSLMELPEGYLWNPETQRFDLVDPKYKEQTAAKRPLIKVMIGNKVHYL